MSHSVNGHLLLALGIVKLICQINKEKYFLVFHIFKENLANTLVGRTGLDLIYPHWRQVFCKNSPPIDSLRVKSGFTSLVNDVHSEKLSLKNRILDQFQSVFNMDIKPIKNDEASVELKEGTIPVFRKKYAIAYTLQDKVKEGLRKLQQQGILSPVTYSEWATSIVVVPKKDTSEIRICAF